MVFSPSSPLLWEGIEYGFVVKGNIDAFHAYQLSVKVIGSSGFCSSSMGRDTDQQA